MTASLTQRGPHRLPSGGLIDRDAPIRFVFDGASMAGNAGDTLASALLANGVRLFGRSFKYHRPRGVFSAGSEEPNALVELRTGARREPNTKATTIELFEGLVAQSQNRFPSLAFDLGAVNSLFSPFFVAGFYYKTFMWPAAFWEKVYEPLIRRAAGLGRASEESDPDCYEKAFAFCDILIIGAGVSGLAAALAAARAGARVILCDEDARLGGRLNSERLAVDEQAGADWAAQALAELRNSPNVRIMPRTTVFGLYDGQTFGALERVADHLVAPPIGVPRQRLWKIVARHSILAAGATERPLMFAGNDRPGVMLASAVRTYINRFAVTPGSRLAVFTTTDDGWKTAFDAAAAGVKIVSIIDARATVRPDFLTRARAAGASCFVGAAVDGALGRRALKGVVVRRAQGDFVRLECDVLGVSGGFNPQCALAAHLGNRPVWSDALAAYVPGALPPGLQVAGAAAGRWSLSDALASGTEAAQSALTALGFASTAPQAWKTSEDCADLKAFWSVRDSRGKAFVDLQHDVTASDIALSEREGFRSVEHLKRYTTLGMATDQGRTSNVNGLAIMAHLTGATIQETGATLARPPYTPVAIAAFAGRHRGKSFKPTRLTSGHAWASEQGAAFVESGLWLRAQWFAKPDEGDWLATVSREVATVREHVGICDVSTLGKIDIQGPDAATLLDRLYANAFLKLPIGKARYGVMLREDGFVLDDGTTARFDDNHFVMSTTTANAARVMQHIEFARQVLWPNLDVQAVSVTERWAQYSIAGPNARRLLELALGANVDVTNEALPFMGCVEFRWNGAPARLFRISFSGELAFEIAVPARFGDAAIRALMEAGRTLNVCPYGVEALGVMRIEKGHVAGNEINGTTTLIDLGLGRMASKTKYFIGKTLAQRPVLVAPARPKLCGFKPVDVNRRMRAGAHFMPIDAPATPANDQGYMTSVAYSPSLRHWIGLGLLSRGPERYGQRALACDDIRGERYEVEICPPCFIDPDGAKLHV